MNLPTRIFGIDAEEAYQKYLKSVSKEDFILLKTLHRL